MARAPFRVYKANQCYWGLRRSGGALVGYFRTPGEAIDYAYKNWPWWP